MFIQKSSRKKVIKIKTSWITADVLQYQGHSPYNALEIPLSNLLTLSQQIVTQSSMLHHICIHIIYIITCAQPHQYLNAYWLIRNITIIPGKLPWIFPGAPLIFNGLLKYPGYRWRVDSPHKGQWRRALMFSLICAWDVSDLRRHRAH